MASKETLSVWKKTLVVLTLGRIVLRIWMFVAKITDEFIHDWTFCEFTKQFLKRHRL
jgi:hypothetical protein